MLLLNTVPHYLLHSEVDEVHRYLLAKLSICKLPCGAVSCEYLARCGALAIPICQDHPGGTIHCPKCHAEGRTQPMEVHDPLDESFLPSGGEEPPNLRTYRCPACENIEIFRVV